MIIGQTLFYHGGGAGQPDAYYSPWFPRGGNEMHTTVDVIAVLGGPGALLEIEIETKNSEQDDLAAAPAASGGVNPRWGPFACILGRTTHVAGAGIGDPGGPGPNPAGLLELVRFKYIIGDATGDGVHFRILNPAWLSNGA